MKNAATAAKKRSISEGADAEPPAKRSNNAATIPSWSDLTPELLGQIARFVPMRTPDMMRLLLCVGPRVAAVVCKMYLTANEYYLWTYMEEYTTRRVKKGRVKEFIAYWMKYNEKEWKKRCLGKKHKENVHSVMLTPEEFRSLDLNECFGLNYVSDFDEVALDWVSLNVMMKVMRNSPILFLISVGDKDVDEGQVMTEEECDSLINSTPTNSDGKICVRFMRRNDVLFANPPFYLIYDLVDVLKVQIEEKIIEPRTTFTSVDDNGDLEHESLLFLALMTDSIPSTHCFHYLLSLPGTDINAIALSRGKDDSRYYENIIHASVSYNDILPSYLKGILAHSNVDLNARNIFGETALCRGCRIKDLSDHATTKLRLLLEAGADPRVEDDDGDSPLSNIDDQISDMEASEEDCERIFPIASRR